jgi:hypothetical protein
MSEMDLRLAAVERYFQSARQAEISDYWARITGQNCSLIKYEVVANHLHLRQQIPVGHQMVALHQIVGSVGRYREFNKHFMPRRPILQDRWVAVDVMMNSLKGLPPVELYKIGDAYFVVDGNHRISVARANGNKDIEAKVIEWQTDVHFTVADFASDRWLSKARYGEFLAQTKLHQLLPGVELILTDGRQYETLLQHIAVHRYLSNQPRRNDHLAMSWGEAVNSWYHSVYLPIVEAMRADKLLARFPKRTETDLYIAITQHRERIAELYELAPLGAETAVKVFAASHSDRLLDRAIFALRESITARLGLGVAKMPAGMSATEFEALRLRHAAGELSLTEAGRKATQEDRFTEPLCEGNLSVQFSG